MHTVLPKAEPGIALSTTRISVEPAPELPKPSSRRPYGPGDVIDGKYELEALLGKGGMGEVWTARNATLDVRRAVKLIRADAASADATDRLLHEAQATARLAEPAIVHIFDFGKTASGDPYIVMEMLEGEDLMSVIRRRERLSPIKAVRVLLPMIRALCGAHAHGIVHRDLKPENIFLAKLPDGRVQPKLLDFGIAKLKNAIGLRLTTDGAVMGSPLYMAPEQARGEDVDERADIWALSVVLYEAITGQPPFMGEDRAQVMRAVEGAEPARLSQHNVSDDSLWPILSRGLAKRREDRWPSMEELGQALVRWLQAHGVSDDVTGASLEAVWFRSSRQSLFGSSSPPLRASLAGPKGEAAAPSEAATPSATTAPGEAETPNEAADPNGATAPGSAAAATMAATSAALPLDAGPRDARTPGQAAVAWARARGVSVVARLLPLARALSQGAQACAERWRSQGRSRWGVGALLLAVLLGATISIAWLVDGSRSAAAAAMADEPPLPTEPAPFAIVIQPVPLGLEPPATSTKPPLLEAPRTPADEAARRAVARDAARARRKAEAEAAAKGESKEHRRSKLIDPYR